MDVKIISWNSHSLRNKYTELTELIDRLSIDVVLICESWLTCDDKFDIPGFTSYRSDRFRGGVAIFIRSSIPHFGFTKTNFDFAESCTVSIFVDNIAVKLSSIYCSPSATRIQSKAFFQKVLSQTGSHIIAGDFNCKHNEWNNPVNDRKGSDLLNLLNDSNFRIFKPDQPTLYPYKGDPSIVDFMVAKSFNSLSQVTVLNELSSDHLPLLFAITGSTPRHISDSVNLSKVNWPKFIKLVDSDCQQLLSTNLISEDSVDSMVNSISTSILNALKCTTPRKKEFLLRYKYSHTVNLLIKTRNSYRNLYKRSRDVAFKSSMNVLNRMIRQQVMIEKKAAFEDKLKSLTFRDNSLFKFAKSLKRKNHSFPPITDISGTYFSDKDKADAIARSFQTSFSAVNNSRSKYDKIVTNSIQSIPSLSQGEAELIQEEEIKFVLQSLNPHKAPGHDKIPNCALKALSNSPHFVLMCSNIFNSCLRLSYFPKNWKIAKITPIPKVKSKICTADDFRPISLLSCLGKCFEKIILKRLNEFESENNIFIRQQCGFRSQLSTVHQILRISEKISFGFNENKSTGMALLDLRKAFDSVWHDGLLHKLINNNYPTYLIKILQSYLQQRSAYVTCQSAHSFIFDVLSGVPQGSLIAPHLFNLFLNDIPIPTKGDLCLYADDTAYFVQYPWKNLKSIKSDLIKTVGNLQTYFHDWKIKLNKAKTEFIIFSKSTKMLQNLINDPVIFNGQTFNWKDTVKYLGVILDRKLTFKQHVEHAVNKASAASFSSLYCILNRKSCASIDCKLRIYKSHIRPILTYACPVFANAAHCHLNKLQLFENKLLRMIQNIHWNDFKSTEVIHDSANIPLISKFMSRLTANFYSKVVHLQNNLFSNLGQYNQDSLSFRVKHKLPKPM